MTHDVEIEDLAMATYGFQYLRRCVAVLGGSQSAVETHERTLVWNIGTRTCFKHNALCGRRPRGCSLWGCSLREGVD